MVAQSLPQRVARAAGEGWCCLFTGMPLALKGWMRRKLSLQVLVGLPWASARSAPPRDDTWQLGWPALALGRPERHVALGLGALALGGSQPALPYGTPSVWAACPCTGLDRAPCVETWSLSCLPLRWVRPERHVALGLASLALDGSQGRAPMWGHLALGLSSLAQGQTRAPRGAEVFAPLPGLMDPASGPNFLKSFVRTQSY